MAKYGKKAATKVKKTTVENMPKTFFKLILGSALLIAAPACAPGQPTLDPNAINTTIAQTLQAVSTQTAELGIPNTEGESPTPTISPEVPTAVPTLSATMTAIHLFTSTPSPNLTPDPVQISVSVPTNCRVGPGRVYDRVGGLFVGEVAEVVGRNVAGNYWIIRTPDRSGTFCWLWGEYATVTGNPNVLPVYTPPPPPTFTPTSIPTPTISFTVSYSGKETCTGENWWVEVVLENTGKITFESISYSVTDTTTGVTAPLFSDIFTDNIGCDATDRFGALPPEVTHIVSSSAFSYDPAGHPLTARITICSNSGLEGTCTTQIIQFTP